MTKHIITKHVITYELTPAGQRAALAAGMDGAAIQSIELDLSALGDELRARYLALASVASDGSSVLALATKAAWGETDWPELNLRPWGAPQTVEELIRTEAVRRELLNIRKAGQKAEKARVAREETLRLLEGGAEGLLEERYGSWGPICLPDESAPGAADLLAAARALAESRNEAESAEAERSREEKKRAESERQKNKWLYLIGVVMAHGSNEQRTRLRELLAVPEDDPQSMLGMLPYAEAVEVARMHLFAPLAGYERYARITEADLGGCEGVGRCEGDECPCLEDGHTMKCTTEEPVPASASAFDKLTKIRAAAPAGARVTLRQHDCWCTASRCWCTAERYGIRVEIDAVDGLTLSCEYSAE